MCNFILPFLTYYFTVSGHSNYNWTGQRIAIKNRKLVSNLPYNETAKAYLATQIELDKALELLIQRLKESGKLEDTVIALVGDHYPYTMTVEEINDLSTYKKDKQFEVHHSNFIIWNSEQETINVDKHGSQIDVLPTLLNLFGIEYDSRLILGNDILSDNDGLVIFSNRSWITEKGRYDANKEEFIPNKGIEVDETYIDKINKEVANKFSISKLIVETDYYSKILK